MVTIFGLDIPVAAWGMSCAGLLLARAIAPPPLRKLNRCQHLALTLLLLLVLTLIVTGAFTGQKLDPGLAVVWGVGLGFSGLVAVEFFGQRVLAMMSAMFGATERPNDRPS